MQDESEAHAGAEKLAAVVVPDFEYLKQNKIANSKEAIRHALDNLGRELPEYQRVRDYIIRVEPLPRTATRKIKRFRAKERDRDRRQSAGALKRSKAWELRSPRDASCFDPTAALRLSSLRSGRTRRTPRSIHPDMNLEIDLGLD